MNTLQVELLKVSTDKGQSWSEKQVDVKNLNVETSVLKVGDWIERNGNYYEVKLSTIEKMEGLLQASAIVEYTVANRSFDKYAEAVKYCNECDLDIELNL